jgi:hypothetical protein
MLEVRSPAPSSLSWFGAHRSATTMPCLAVEQMQDG